MQRKFQYYAETMKKLGLTGSELAAAIGYSKTTWFKWRAEGVIPQVAGLACECLLRRARKDGRQDTFIMSVPGDKVAAMEAICSSMDVEVHHLNGAG
jgi:hypothetical protein